LEANQQVIENQTEDNFENRKEYVKLIETPFQNMMLDKQVLRTKESLIGHRWILPQKVVQHDVWTGGL
jgi:hypothetical protein